MIVKLKAPTKNYIWGGDKLKEKWHKQSDKKIAESWELSFCKGDESVVAEGKFAGKKLSDVTTRKDWGKNCNCFDVFPTLVKLIDAKQNLSVQVHPDDEYALKNEGQLGKTEMWYILDADDGAGLYLGLNKTMTAEEFLQAVKDKTVCNFLNFVPVKAGDTYFVQSGTFHAIGAGVTLLEVQQNSTLTYRVYDFDRVGKDGKPRPLHLDKAMKVGNLNKYIPPDARRGEFLGGCKYFSAYRYSGEKSLCMPDSYLAVTAIDGDVQVDKLLLQQGETAFVSAGEKICVSGGSYVVTCVEG